MHRYDFLEGNDFCAWVYFLCLTFGYDFLEGCGGSDFATLANSVSFLHI